MFSIYLLFEISYYFDATNIIFFFQNWGDYTDMSQAVFVYVFYACDVVLICWFGTQLTQHVRQNGLLLLLLTFTIFYVHKVYVALNQLRNYGTIWVLTVSFTTRRSAINLLWHILKMSYKISDNLLGANHSKYYNYFENK